MPLLNTSACPRCRRRRATTYGNPEAAPFNESRNSLHLLQEVGEHAHCGRGNVAASGFSYDPQSFMVAGIGVYNLSWRDMGVPSLHRILEIVQVGLLWEFGVCGRVQSWTLGLRC